MPNNTPWFQNNWFIGGITFIVGLLAGWLITQWVLQPNNGNGKWSTYTKDSVGKITLTVQANTNGVITSELFGPNSKSVWVQQVGSSLHIPYFGATPPNTDHTCNAEPFVGWVLPPGNYEVYISSSAGPCSPTHPTTPYPNMPSVYSSMMTIVLPGSGLGPRQIQTDSYRFQTGSAGDETHITVVMQSF